MNDRTLRGFIIMMTHYQCGRCTNCCNWPGEVIVSDIETTAMAKELGLSANEFTEKYTKLREQRRGLTLKNNQNVSRVLLKDRSCLVHSTKPKQCKDFPNNWRFKGWRQICDATPKKIIN